MSTDPANHKGSRSINLSFILYFFKAIVLLFFLTATMISLFQMHNERDYLQSDISFANDKIAQLNKKIKICINSTSKKTASSSDCADAHAQRKLETAKVAAYKKELGEFKNQYYALCVWIPGFVAACLMLIGRYVGFAGLIAIINCAVPAYIPGLFPLYKPAQQNHIWWVILIIFLAMLGHGYSLYLSLVPDEATQKTKEPPSDE